MADFVGCLPSDPVVSGQYLRFAFEESFTATLLHGLETKTGDSNYFQDSLASLLKKLSTGSVSGLEYLTPLNGPEISSGDGVTVLDCKTFKPTVAVNLSQLVRSLDSAATGLQTRSIIAIQLSDIGAAGRLKTKQTETEKQKDESLLDRLWRWLKALGVILLVFLAFVAYASLRNYGIVPPLKKAIA